MKSAVIKGYPNYAVFEDGTVINIKRNKPMKQRNRRDGYMSVQLSNDGKQKEFVVHRLVAAAFIPNPNNYPIINHKDENKKNNCADNLEWCTQEYNINYGTGNARRAKSLEKYRKSDRARAWAICLGEMSGKPIEQLTIDGKHIAFYQSARKASMATGSNHCGVCRAARGLYETAGGYKWKYVKEE